MGPSVSLWAPDTGLEASEVHLGFLTQQSVSLLSTVWTLSSHSLQVGPVLIWVLQRNRTDAWDWLTQLHLEAEKSQVCKVGTQQSQWYGSSWSVNGQKPGSQWCKNPSPGAKED